MTLEETIAHHRWAADNCVGEVRDEHLRMAEWLEELVELRAENVKLKELVQEAVDAASLKDMRDWRYGKRLAFLREARELGIEVEA